MSCQIIHRNGLMIDKLHKRFSDSGNATGRVSPSLLHPYLSGFINSNKK